MNTPGYERARRDAPRMVESVIAATPSGRIAEPQEVAALAVFLLSDACAAMAARRARDSPARAGRRRRLTSTGNPGRGPRPGG
jgi:NAD(P)-dependent dehydrogenase (short-subunit alcohol dehydrogenase family)